MKRLSRLALVGGFTVGGLALLPPTPAAPQERAPAPAGVTLFDARAVGSIGSFSFHVPEAFFPFEITGGMLESTSRATSSPQAFGTAGLAPVPLATSIGLVIPKVVPGTEIPVPEDVQDAFKSIDFTALPNGCQASYPPVSESGDEATCGGPYQRDAALGFTAAGLNGHVRTSGTFEDPFATRTASVSRAGDVTVPGLQAKLHQAWSQGTTGMNEARLPEGRAVAEIDSLSILGNLLRIEGIRSETIAATDGTPEGAVVRSSLTIRAASVFGIPVVIGPDGVSVNHQAVPSTDVKPLAAQVESALAEAGGMRVRLVPAPPVQVREGEVTAGSGAVEISYLSQNPTPVNVMQRFAYTRARVNAVPESAGSEVVAEAPDVSLGSPEGANAAAGGQLASPGGVGPSVELDAGPSVALDVGTGSVASGAGSGVTEPAGSRLPPFPEAAAAPEASGGLALSPGTSVGVPPAVAARTSGFDLASRTRLKAVYGGVAGLSLFGLALIPLLRAMYRRLSAPTG